MTSIPSNIPPIQRSSGGGQFNDIVPETILADPPQYVVAKENLGAEYAADPGATARRPGNVYSGLSIDDIEAAQTLEVLRSGTLFNPWS